MLRKSADHLSQHKQALVNVNALPLVLLMHVPSLLTLLRPSQVYQLELADSYLLEIVPVDCLHSDCEDRVRPAALVVQIVGGHDLVLNTQVVELKHLLLSLTLEDVQVLHLELVLLAPPQSEAGLLLLRGLLCQTQRLRLEEVLGLLTALREVQQIVDLFVVDLQERAEDGGVLLLLSRSGFPEYILDNPGDDAQLLLVLVLELGDEVTVPARYCCVGAALGSLASLRTMVPRSLG